MLSFFRCDGVRLTRALQSTKAAEKKKGAKPIIPKMEQSRTDKAARIDPSRMLMRCGCLFHLRKEECA